MDTPTLVAPDIERGRAVLRALDEAHVPIRSAFWLYFREADEWRLVLGTPLVEDLGPRAAYNEVEKTLKGEAGLVPLRQIVILGMEDPLRKRLVSVIKRREREAGTMLPTGFAGEPFGGLAYAYRSTCRGATPCGVHG